MTKKNSIRWLYFFIEIALSLLLYSEPMILTICLVVTAVLGWFLLFDRKERTQYLVGAAIGFLGEIICVNMGVWVYQYAGVFGVPLWLPLAWGNAVVFTSWIATMLYEKKSQ